MIMFKTKNNVIYEIDNNDILKFYKKAKKNSIEEKMLLNEYNYLINHYNGNYPVIRRLLKDDKYTTLEMDYISGSVLEKLKKIDISKKIAIIKNILYELKSIHDNGYLHCDINLNNIILTNKKVKIIDFGLATKIGEKCAFNFGTLKYVSKEQLNNEVLDERTDIYSFGILMLEFVFNIDLYKNKKIEEIKMLKNNVEFIDVLKYTENKDFLEYQFLQIINNCIQNDRNLRYKNIDEILNDFKKMNLTII